MRSDALDFWLGDWDCTWDGGRATNSIDRILDGRVIRERFESHEPHRWSGTSMSAYETHSGTWRQTWVDSAGVYWHFVGELVGGNMAFATPEPVDEDQLYKRMIFHNLGADEFDWRWECSPDRDTWETRWQLHYERRADDTASPSAP